MRQIVVAYSSKQKQHFFEGLINTASTWQGQFGPHNDPVTIRFVPLLDEDVYSQHSPLPLISTPSPPSTPSTPSTPTTPSSPSRHSLSSPAPQTSPPPPCRRTDVSPTPSPDGSRCTQSSSPLRRQTVVHAVLQKRTDDMATALLRGPDVVAAERRLAVLDKTQTTMRAARVDDLRAVQRLVDRARMSRVIDRALTMASSPFVYALPWAHITARRRPAAALRAALRCTPALRFPLILKRRLACGTKTSHEMVIAYNARGARAALVDIFGFDNDIDDANDTDDDSDDSDGSYGSKDTVVLHADDPKDGDESDATDSAPGYSVVDNGVRADLVDDDDKRHADDENDDDGGEDLGRDPLVFGPGPLDDFERDVVAQQYVPQHGGVLFKVYAIGGKVAVQSRPSVRPAQDADDCLERGYYAFHSQQLGRGEGDEWGARFKPPDELVEKIVHSVQRELGLSMVGVDVVYDLWRKVYYVVDVNYFPGYKGVGEVYDWILEEICERVWLSGTLGE